jgi:CDP-paratose 2-epimerase
MTKKILITGGAGFVGSSLGIKIKANYPHYTVVAMDNLKRRGSELNIKRLKAQDIQFVHGDIRQKSDFDTLDKDFTSVIEASAEPSVLSGLTGSADYLIDTNLNGTINCLNFTRTCSAEFIFLSTSRVYPIERIEAAAFSEGDSRFVLSADQVIPGLSKNGISEDFSLQGYRSLYGATKLASELMIQEFNHFYNIKTVINRCGVLTGPWQMGKVDQGVVVLWLARHYWKNKLGYFGYGGKGKQVRDMLHTDDLYRLIDIQLHNMTKVNGEVFNVGGGQEVSLSLRELTQLCEKITGNTIEIAEVKENRQADIRIYITDNQKVTNFTGWKPEIMPEKILTDIFEWIKKEETVLKDILN